MTRTEAREAVLARREEIHKLTAGKSLQEQGKTIADAVQRMIGFGGNAAGPYRAVELGKGSCYSKMALAHLFRPDDTSGHMNLYSSRGHSHTEPHFSSLLTRSTVGVRVDYKVKTYDTSVLMGTEILPGNITSSFGLVLFYMQQLEKPDPFIGLFGCHIAGTGKWEAQVVEGPADTPACQEMLLAAEAIPDEAIFLTPMSIGRQLVERAFSTQLGGAHPGIAAPHVLTSAMLAGVSELQGEGNIPRS